MSTIDKIMRSKVWLWAMDIIAKIEWPRLQAVINGGMYYCLKEEDHDTIRRLMKEHYLIAVTRRKSHLSSQLIPVGEWILTRKFPHYTHVLMNVEGDLDGHVGFKLIEATGKSNVDYVTFMGAFDCDSVALLKPKGVTMEQWTIVLDRVKNSLGTPYDTLFDITTDDRMSCVELIYWGLRELSDFEIRYPQLIKLIEQGKNLTPQMFYDSGEFEVVFEARR